MYHLKKYLYMSLGFFCVGMAYIGFVTPGIPFSIFLVIAAWAFSKSSKRMHDWLYNHPWFGEFLTNWTHYKVFPLKAKYAMIVVMSSTVLITYYATGNLKAVIYSSIFMSLIAFWAWHFPSTKEEYDERIKHNKKIGLFR